MAPNSEELTHEEIWDDSALVDSWNDALDEYKKYHSIHSKGGNVNDLIDSEVKVEDGGARISSIPEQTEELISSERAEPENANGLPCKEATAQPKPPLPMGSAFPPVALMGSLQDEGLKKLLMSWYYAGYYTGYYEGQRNQADQGRTNANADMPKRE